MTFHGAHIYSAILLIWACLEIPSPTLLQLAAALNQGRELGSLKVHT